MIIFALRFTRNPPMRKLINIAIIMIIVAVLLTAAATGYLWYGAKQQMDQIATLAKPMAEIRYEGIVVSPTGSLGVRNLRITPNFINDFITMGAIRLHAPNLLALLNIRWQLSRGELPGALALSFEDIELPLHGGLLGASPAQAPPQSPLDGLSALGCGPVSRFSGNEWQEMGYDRFVSTFTIGYRIDARNNRLELRLDSNTRDWAMLNLNLGFAAPTPPRSLLELGAFKPRLAQLNLVLRDDGFNHRRNNYCAVKAGKTLPDYLTEHVRLAAERLRANGVTLGPGLIAAYQRYLTEGGVLTVTANPPAPINPDELGDYAPADVIKLLGLTVKVNDTAITDLTVDWNNAQVAKALGVAPEPPPASELDETPTPLAVQKPSMIQKTYHPTPVNALGQHVGKIAKLRTTTGTQYRGQLESVAEGMIRITARKSGGSVTFSLRSSEIAAAEVLY